MKSNYLIAVFAMIVLFAWGVPTSRSADETPNQKLSVQEHLKIFASDGVLLVKPDFKKAKFIALPKNAVKQEKLRTFIFNLPSKGTVLFLCLCVCVTHCDSHSVSLRVFLSL